MQLYMGLASEGYEMSYRRIPLSRERTPEAADLDTLHSQLQNQPAGDRAPFLHEYCMWRVAANVSSPLRGYSPTTTARTSTAGSKH